MFYELDSVGNYVCDAPHGVEGLTDWTETPVPQPIYTPKFEGVKNTETGEWTGEWIDLGKSLLVKTLRSESVWVSEQMTEASYELGRFSDGHSRARATESEWVIYRNELRDYIINGVVVGDRPASPLV